MFGIVTTALGATLTDIIRRAAAEGVAAAGFGGAGRFIMFGIVAAAFGATLT